MPIVDEGAETLFTSALAERRMNRDNIDCYLVRKFLDDNYDYIEDIWDAQVQYYVNWLQCKPIAPESDDDEPDADKACDCLYSHSNV